jgi:hypothetical protein
MRVPVLPRIGRWGRLVGLLLGAALLWSGGARAQSDDEVSLSMQAQPAEVGTEGLVTVEIQVRGAPLSTIQTPRPPPTTNLVLQESTPVTQREVSFDSGRLTRRVTFTWRYRPMRVGIGRIRPVTVQIRGDAYETEEVRVRIVPQSQRPDRPPRGHARPGSGGNRGGDASRSRLAPRDLFIRATASTDTAYQNEQVTAEYRLYFRPGVRLRQSRMVDAWDAPGFWREELDVDARPTPRVERLNGQNYKTIVLKRVALFPTRPGRLTVDPLQIETEARAEGTRGPEGRPPPRTSYEPVTLASDSLTVAVRPLPGGAPAAFDGAVGQYTLTTHVSTDSVAVGEGIDLVARLRGRGNLATLSPPRLDAPAGLEVFDPTVETTLDRREATIHGEKTFTYTLVPQENGQYTLPPVRFAYFDPEAGRYETLRSKPTALEVTGEAAPRAVGRMGSGLPIGDIAGPMDAPPRWGRPDAPPLYARPWAYAALAAPLLLAAGAMAYRRRDAGGAEAAPDAPEATAAGPSLDAAERALRDGDARAVHRAVERAVVGRLDRRLDLPRPAARMTAEALADALARRDVPAATRRALREVLDACNQAQFAPTAPSPDGMERTLDRARQVLRRLDDHLPAA